jgi:hypothetical protein
MSSALPTQSTQIHHAGLAVRQRPGGEDSVRCWDGASLSTSEVGKLSDPHHLRFTQSRALRRKVSNEFVVSLWRIHRREAHRAGDVRAWWEQVGIDPVEVARELWRKARLNDGTLQPSVRTAPTGLDAAVCPDGEVGNEAA